MQTRKGVLQFGLSFPDTYLDAPFHDPNWQLVRVRKNKKAFLWTYEKDGKLCINVKVDPQWRDLWRMCANHEGAKRSHGINVRGHNEPREVKV